MFAEPEFWVAVGFVILMGVFAYVGVHRTVLTALDHRSERIKAELDDARRLKQEAANLLDEYKVVDWTRVGDDDHRRDQLHPRPGRRVGGGHPRVARCRGGRPRCVRNFTHP